MFTWRGRVLAEAAFQSSRMAVEALVGRVRIAGGR